jgi:enoyl-CoA hydratase
VVEQLEQIRVERPGERVARIVLSRPRKRNAQTFSMLYELDRAFRAATSDDDVRVIILAAEGPHFSAGHDQVDRGVPSDIKTTGSWFGYDLPGLEGTMARNREVYFDLCWRWRNIPKPVIAEAQGKSIGGGLMLLWICDLIVAASDATFADPTVAIGCNGVEYFAHPWELGSRKAKEMLFAGAWLSASEAKRAGMVNRIVAPDELSGYTLALAEQIAQKPSVGLKLAKEAVNTMLDAQGQYGALKQAFLLCTIGHAQLMLVGRPEGGYGAGFFGGPKTSTADTGPNP